MKRRILHAIPFLWSGAGGVVTRLCQSQASKTSVAIVTSGRSRGFSDWPVFRRRLSKAGIARFTVNMFDRDPDVFWRAVSSFNSLVREFKPHVVHCHSGVPACMASMARRDSDTKFTLISQFHSWGIDRPEWMNTMDLWGFRQSDYVVCSAKSTRQILIRGGIPQNRIRVISWGLPLEEIGRFSRPSACFRTTGIRLGYVGRIEPRKNQVALVRAFKPYHNRNPESKLFLVGPVGDRKYAQEARDMIRKLNLQKNVMMVGQRRNVYRYMSEWDLFVSMSKDEGQGLALLEAMLLGVPVLACSVSGIRDYLKHGYNGLVLNSMEPSKAADMIEWVFTHPDKIRRITARAQSMVKKKYSWEDTLDRISVLYKSAENATSAPRI